MSGVIERVKKHRDALRRRGMRPVQIWVPDTRRPGFAEECKRQSLLVKNDKQEKDVLEFLDEAADREGWEA
ncbi:MAG: antitoxin MazE family protein [Chlorobium phaeobacteroides]|uniref:Antitoxin MazE n=1 Tax=Chlorobium phaeobacteroides (strain BS1) TaxID=331678 RepID=B3ENF6_CHLPB|nr:antitoxin MazE family protein [Chlorobium phaeobacteroides]NEX14927.1 DUF3018 domain-containing protein [Prosthecochloris sp.]